MRRVLGFGFGFRFLGKTKKGREKLVLCVFVLVLHTLLLCVNVYGCVCVGKKGGDGGFERLE